MTQKELRKIASNPELMNIMMDIQREESWNSNGGRTIYEQARGEKRIKQYCRELLEAIDNPA